MIVMVHLKSREIRAVYKGRSNAEDSQMFYLIQASKQSEAFK